jgi:hypothetical protein
VSLQRRVAPAARATLKGAAAFADTARRPPPGITILIYHRVGAGTGGQMDLSPAAFDAQLRWLKETQRVLALDAALAELVSSSPTATSGVVLTFDDGTTDWVDHVLPALERHGVPATFYVATSFVEDRTEFPGGGRPLDWSGLGELASSELTTIGSHTHRHLLLDRLPPDEVDAELERSVELLRDRVGVRAEHFAYPKAVAGSPSARRPCGDASRAPCSPAPARTGSAPTRTACSAHPCRPPTAIAGSDARRSAACTSRTTCVGG